MTDSSPEITPAAVSKPLHEFSKIGHNTYTFTPPRSSPPSRTPSEEDEDYDDEKTTKKQPPPPPLIFYLAWNAAAAKHIAKYTIAYQKLFPKSQILLIRCNTPDMFRRESSYATLMAPAINVVQRHVQSGGEVLLHSCSNGGGNQLVEFAKAWRKAVGGFPPMRAQILDSSPGVGSWRRSYAAISMSLPKSWVWRVFGPALVHLLLLGNWVVNWVLRRENNMVVMCRQLNNEGLFDKRVPRVYLYSKADAMVGWGEVEDHAVVAKCKGWDVETVRFENSAHCSHVREDEARYWGAILEAWKKGPHDA